MAAPPCVRDTKPRKSSPSKARSASPVRMLSSTNPSLPDYASMPSPMLCHQSAAPAYTFGLPHDSVLVNGPSNNFAYHSLDHHSQQSRVTINHTSPMQTSVARFRYHRPTSVSWYPTCMECQLRQQSQPNLCWSKHLDGTCCEFAECKLCPGVRCTLRPQRHLRSFVC